MNESKGPFPYIEVYRASKQLKYDHVKPGGVLQTVYCLLSVLFLMLLQNAFFASGPSLVLVFVYLISVKCKWPRAITLGTLSGLALDVFFGRYMGLQAMLMLYTALAVSLLSERLFDSRQKILGFGLPIFLIYRILESFMARLLCAAGNGGRLYTDYASHFTGYILPWALLAELVLAAMILPVYALWRRFSRH